MRFRDKIKLWLVSRIYPIIKTQIIDDIKRGVIIDETKFRFLGENVRFSNVELLLGEEFIEIGNGSDFGRHIYLTAWKSYQYKNKGVIEQQQLTPSIKIGQDCRFGDYNHITATNSIIIGDGCLTGKWVTITDNSHGLTDLESLKIEPVYRPVVSKGPVSIGKNVWIGDKATVLPNVSIGEGAVIGANAVVTKDIPPYSIVAGNPARILKTNDVLWKNQE